MQVVILWYQRYICVTNWFMRGTL